MEGRILNRSVKLLLLSLGVLATIATLAIGVSQPAEAGRIVTVKKKANVRKGAGVNHPIHFTAFQYYPLEVLEEKGKWLKVRDYEGDVGWVARIVVSATPGIVVKTKKANVRTGPSTKVPIAFIAERGVAMKVLAKKEKWLQVEHADGEKGWIFNTLVWGN